MLPTFLLTFAALSASPTEAAEIRLRSAAVCPSTIVRLTDIADITAADPRLAQALAEVPVCPAPAAGTERTLSQNELRQLLAISGVEQDRFRVAGSDTVTIHYDRTAQATVQRPLVASGVRQAVFMEEVEPKKTRLVRPAAAPIAPPASAPKATEATLVERGTVVTVIARTAGVRITASGKALDAGAAGEAISIELADSKQRVLGRITGPQTVEMSTPGLSN